MRIRKGFVSNSSSTAFIITNKSDEPKTLVNFVEENPQLVRMFNEEYGCDYTQEQLIESAEAENIIFDAKKKEWCRFGDEDGTVIGNVFDYILREGGSSASFSWHFDSFLR